MDLAKVPNEKKLYLCRWYFRVGFALLPFVWTVNVIWFFNEAFKKPEYEEQKHIKKICCTVSDRFCNMAGNTDYMGDDIPIEQGELGRICGQYIVHYTSRNALNKTNLFLGNIFFITA
ncbi:hypothetical protein NQ314_003143 [Rhamnusium bicolor]|uniref:Gamma-secretase subunit PEN-2 n=1 Tax=Rhamnusium bicolor TaxID=1586634 RepID=A0AAV8ZPY1_9CUCU|nr:hypothetical protein NQ314_003143 [Rhamnusium bicolor]